MKYSSILTVFSVATLLAVNAQDQPQAGYILGGAHTEFGVSSHNLYVTYPGIQDATKAIFMIEKREEDQTYTFVHNFTLESEVEKPFTYFFALRNTEKGDYTVKFCKEDENTCSKRSSPPTVIDDGNGKLDCKEIDENVNEIAIRDIDGYADSDYLAQYKDKMPKSIAKKEEITTNPTYIKKDDDKGFMYFLVKYKLSAYKALFQVESDEDKYCRRKYSFMVITQVFDKNTKKILKRGRFTPRPLTKDEHIEKYITGNEPEDAPIEFKLNMKLDQVKRDDLQIWHSVCLSAKDMVSSRENGFAAKCSQPFETEWTPYTESL